MRFTTILVRIALAVFVPKVDHDSQYEQSIFLSVKFVKHNQFFRLLTRREDVVSRTGRTEYQLLLMEASDRG